MHSDRCQAEMLYASNAEINYWLQSTIKINQEKDTIACLSPGCFGYFALQLGISDRIDTLGPFPIPEKLYLATTPLAKPTETVKHLKNNLLYADPLYLPLEDGACDLVIVHHLHELVDNPHQCIREAARVVRHEGYIFILGSYPNFKQVVLRTLLPKSKKWQIRLMSSYRLKDWLRLVDFSEQQQVLGSTWIEKTFAKHRRLAWLNTPLQFLKQILPIGSNFYCIKAQKHVTAPLISLDTNNQPITSMLGNLSKPSASIMPTKKNLPKL